MIKRLADLLRLFSWRQLARMKVAGRLKAWVDRPAIRHMLALREFTWMVPAAQVTCEDGRFSFRFPVEGIQRSFVLRSNTSDIEVFLQVIRDAEYRESVSEDDAEPKSPTPHH